MKIKQIFWQFLLLGLTSFGGPAAHLGYFQTQFVERLRWLDKHEFAQLVALSQVLPGPGSSQVGFAIGLYRGGWLGGLAAFTAFTLPSFILMYLVASQSQDWLQQSWATGCIHALKLLAVAVVAHAVLGMYQSFCQDHRSKVIAALALLILLLHNALFTQLILLVCAAGYGARYLATPNSTERHVEDDKQTNSQPRHMAFGVFVLLLILPLFFQHKFQHQLWQSFAQYFYAGSLVFGGGHVVLPLLQQMVGEHISSDLFFAGYSAAQAIPGPMFTFATYLGTASHIEHPLLGAAIATFGIFSPGLLLMAGLSADGRNWMQRPRIAGAIIAINAAVVGLLAATLYSPLFTSSVAGWFDLFIALAGFACLRWSKLPIVALVAIYVFVGAIVY